MAPILSTGLVVAILTVITTAAPAPIQIPTSSPDPHVFYVLPPGLSSTVTFSPVTPTMTSPRFIPTFTLDCTDLKVISAITTKIITVTVTSYIIETETHTVPSTTSTTEMVGKPLPPVRPHCSASCTNLELTPTATTVFTIPTANPDQDQKKEEFTLGIIQENLESTLLRLTGQLSEVYDVNLASAWEFITTVLRKAETVVERKVGAPGGELEADLDNKLFMKRRQGFLADVRDDVNELKRVFS